MTGQVAPPRSAQQACVRSAHVFVTDACVNDCIFCAVADKRSRGELAKTRARKGHTVYDVLSRLARQGVRRVVITGYGEPTLEPDLGRYIDFASHLGFTAITLFTNGCGSTSERVDEWVEAGLTGVLISVHGLQDGHDKSVGRAGSFQEAMHALETYFALYIAVSVNTCITRDNIEEIPRLQRLLSSYPLSTHSIAFPEWCGNARANPERLLTYTDVYEHAPLLLENCNPFTRYDNIPLCVLGHGPAKQLRFEPSLLITEQEHVTNGGDQRIFPQACSNGACAHHAVCPGLERNYARLNGTNELEPIARRFATAHPRSEPRGAARSRREAAPRGPEGSAPGICVIFKTTARCNARCAYCAAYKESREGELSLEDTRSTIFRLARQAAREGRSKLPIIWHGGEPLLRGKDFYRSLWSIDEHEGVRIEHMVQTNLLNLDEEWIDLTNEYHVPVSTSVDPFDDSLRVLANGKPQYPVWLDRFLLFCRKGEKIGIVFTVGRSHLGREEEIYSFFANLQELTRMPQQTVGIRINPITPVGRAKRDGRATVPTAEEFAGFLHRMLELWLRDNRRFPISPFSDIWRGDHYSCTYASNCQRRFLGVGPGGTLSNCGRFLDLELLYGTVDDSLETRTHHHLVQELEAREPALRSGPCAKCPYWRQCYGGCPVDAYAAYGDLKRETPFCAAYKSMFTIAAQRGGKHG